MPPSATTPTTSNRSGHCRRGIATRHSHRSPTWSSSSAGRSSPHNFGALTPSRPPPQKSTPCAWPGPTSRHRCESRVDIALFVIAVLTLICAAFIVPFAVLTWKQGHRQEQRHTERSDVSWRVDQDEIPGRLRVVNIGRDPAYDVHVVMSVDEETLRSEADVVAADEALGLDSQTLREAMEEK